MSGVITAFNTGFDAGFPLRWLHAFGFAFLVAWPVAFFVAPRARQFAERLCD